ncbi:prepilin-type N-terminal cleavage/methylation domain-containing protein [bacterium]|nr:prepilin-type N-terminal cleavage/methylation domain-containing protein [bacterium]
MPLGLRRRRRAGFTLLEVLVAVAVTASILSIVYATFTRTIESKEYVEEGNDAYHKARWAMDKIALDLSAAYVSPREQSHTIFYGISNQVNGLPMDELHMTTLAHVRLNPTAAESDQSEVSYKVAYLPDEERFQLWRREDAIIDEDNMLGGEEYILIDDLTAFNVRFYDGNVWRNDWDSRGFENQFNADGTQVETDVVQSESMINAVPVAAEVTIAVMGPDLRPIVFSSKVKLEMSTIDLSSEDDGDDDDDTDSEDSDDSDSGGSNQLGQLNSGRRN